MSEELTDTQYELSDVIGNILDTTPETSWTPSALARKANISTNEARIILQWLVTHHMALAVGNGAWTRYSHRPLHTPIS
jgi:predicted transcriptional regulator